MHPLIDTIERYLKQLDFDINKSNPVYIKHLENALDFLDNLSKENNKRLKWIYSNIPENRHLHDLAAAVLYTEIKERVKLRNAINDAYNSIEHDIHFLKTA